MERVRRKEGDVVKSKDSMAMALVRAGQKIEMEAVRRSQESLNGRPLGFDYREKTGILGERIVRGRIARGKLTVTTTQFGQQSDPRIYDWPQGAMMSWAAYREQIKRGLKPGTKYELSLYDPLMSLDRSTPAKVEILGRETLDLYGRKVEAIKAKVTIRCRGMAGQQTDVETTTWFTDDGSQLRMTTSLAGWAIEMVACTKSVALAPNDPAELMLDTLIRPDGPVDPERDKMRYRLTLGNRPGKAEMPSLPETDIQKIVKQAKDEVRLTVARRADRLEKPGKGKLSPEERKRYLAASSVANHKDPVVAKLAKQAAGASRSGSRRPVRWPAASRGTAPSTGFCWRRWAGRAESRRAW